jgi:hypothetical protein
LNNSPAQNAVVKAVDGEPLTQAEYDAWCIIAHTKDPPRPEGYEEVFIQKGRQAGGTLRIAVPLAASRMCWDWSQLVQLTPGQRIRVPMTAPKLEHVKQFSDGLFGVLEAIGASPIRRGLEIDLPAMRTTAEPTVADQQAGRSGSHGAAVVTEPAHLPYVEGADGYDGDVYGSLRPGSVTTRRKGYVLISESTPWVREGVHYETVKAHLGDVSGHILALKAPSWVWNNSISEADTHKLEPNLTRWRREYLGEASDSEDVFVTPAQIARCVDPGVRERERQPDAVYFGVADIGLRRDATRFGIFHREYRQQSGGYARVVLVLDRLVTLKARLLASLSLEQVLSEMGHAVAQYRVRRIYADQHYFSAVAEHFKLQGVRVHELPMSIAAQSNRVGLLLSRVERGSFRLLDIPEANRELTTVKVVRRQGGKEVLAAPEKRGSHDDFVDVCAGACGVEEDFPVGASGDVGHDIDIHRDHNVVTLEQRWYDKKTGVSLPAPPGTPLAEEQARARKAAGIYLPSDFPDNDTNNPFRTPEAIRAAINARVR